MIDPHTGAIKLAAARFLIEPQLTRAEFLAAPIAGGARIFVRNEPFCSYYLGTHELAGEPFGVVLYFHGELLWQVELSAGAPQFGSSWDDWSEAGELARKRLHEFLLERELGRAGGPYPWGIINSVYDPKGGSGSIIVRYADPFTQP